MYKFDTSSMFGSYIKQLLHSFNLPTFRVYTKEQALYKQRTEQELNKITLDISRVKTILKRYAGVAEGTPEAADRDGYKDILEKLETRQQELSANRELNVLSSYIRNDGNHYPNSLNWRQQATSYPEVMTYIPYIKDGTIQEYINGSWVNCHAAIDPIENSHAAVHEQGGYQTIIPYLYNKKYLNRTRNLKIDNNTYDAYTHEYLGDYLRFQRDFNNLDLMPLYNCFSNTICSNLDFTVEITKGVSGVFNSSDQNYKIYMVPVKLFKNYTLAIECRSYVEVFCGLYDTSLSDLVQPDKKFEALPKVTYAFFNSTQFNRPVLYDKLANIKTLLENNDEKLADISQHEQNLKLFIKIPAQNKSSITILEGDYTNYTGGILNKTNASWQRRNNYYAYNSEHIDEYDNFVPLTSLQLLSINTGESYPFSDRLLGYLTDMTITHLDEKEDDIKRAKTVMSQVSSNIINNNLWDDKMLFSIYEYMNTTANTLDNNRDILGYIDNRVEKLYQTNYKVRLQKALDSYNETHKTYYVIDDLKNQANKAKIFDDLIAIDQKLTVLNNHDFTQPIDDSIASVNIYENGGNDYGK